MAGISLSVTGAVQAGVGTQQKTIDLGKHLKTIGIVIFLVVAALLVAHTIFSISAEARKISGKQFSGHVVGSNPALMGHQIRRNNKVLWRHTGFVFCS